MKRKFFSTIAVFFALALTACVPANNEKKEESKPADESSVQEVASSEEISSSAVASDHKHKYGSWTVVQEPTCEEPGVQERVCECGEKQTKEVSPTGHTWDDGVITQAATCSVPGVKTFTCTKCGATKTEEIKADHVWDDGVAVPGEDAEAAYTLFTCTVCNTAKKIEFVAKQASGKSVISGGLKNDTSYPDYLKLNANGDSVTYTFTSTVAGNAVIYMRGIMDYWHDGNNENQTRNFFSGKNSTDGNFELKVNDAAVDYSWSKDITYEDMLPGEAQGTYSPLGDAKVGDCSIINGVNTVVFKRTESYNMLIKDFVIIIG